MRNYTSGGHTQVLIKASSWKEAKKIIRKIGRGYSLTFSEQNAAYRSVLPSLNFIFHKKLEYKNKRHQDMTLDESVLLVSYETKNGFFNDLEKALEKEQIVDFPDDFLEV